MVRVSEEGDWDARGELVLEKLHPDCLNVYFVPLPNKLEEAGLSLENTQEHKTLLLEIEKRRKNLTIYPIKTFAKAFLESKYHQVECITLSYADLPLIDTYDNFPSTDEDILEILENLPLMFTKGYNGGLGLAMPYRFIIDAVEELSDCTKIVISQFGPTCIQADTKVFCISKEDFEKARLELNRIYNNAQKAISSVKGVAAYNILAKSLGRPARTPQNGRSPLRKYFTAKLQDQEPLSDEDQQKLLDILAKNTKVIANRQPEKLAKLQSNIELVSLEKLIERYKEMMKKNSPESKWQAFFNENQFILGLAFGYPIIKIQDQASVGGRTISGKGDAITDFLVKNSMTNNTAILEIKTPQTKLLNTKLHRGDLFSPSSDLSGAVNQALDQKYRFQKEIAQIKDNSNDTNMESYAVHCCLIIGTIPEGDAKKKSFELFRGNSKEVEIVTFDELLEKLQQLHHFLKSEEGDSFEPNE